MVKRKTTIRGIELNMEIPLQEVGAAVSKLNYNRNPVEDNITNELLKSGSGTLT